MTANYGGFIVYGTGGGMTTVTSSRINVDNSTANPTEVKNYYQTNQGIKFDAPFYGPETSLLKVNNWYNEAMTYGAYTYFAGDMSNYLGLLEVGAHHTVVLDANSKVNNLKMNKNSTLKCGMAANYLWCEKVEVDELEAANNPRVVMTIADTDAGCLKIKSGLTVPADQKFELGLFVGASLPRYATESHEFTLLDLPMDASISELIAVSNYNHSEGFTYVKLVEDSIGDRSVLKAVMPKRTYLRTVAGWGSSNLKTKSCWYQVGEEDSLDDMTLICHSGSVAAGDGNNSLRLEYGANASDVEVFNGTIILGNEIYLAQFAHEEFADLRILPGCYWSVAKHLTSNLNLDGVITLYNWGNSDVALAADGLTSKSAKFYPSYDNSVATKLTINAQIKGCGWMSFQPPSSAWGNTAPSSTFVLAGDNSAYAGRFSVLHNLDGRIMTLQVSSAENLGGKLAKFYKDAIRVGNKGVLEATDSFMLEEPTRGINVLGGGTIKVDAEKTMSIASTLTLSGAATKNGAGTLELCGTVVTENGATLAVTEGALKATTRTALSGCAVNFSDGAALTVDGDSSDDDYLAKGIDLASTTLTAGDELLVKVESIQTGGPNRKVAIATDTNAKAAELAAKLTAKLVLASGREKSCTVSCEANDDGVTSTIWADCMRQGLTLIIK